jgi:hypothetical protein
MEDDACFIFECQSPCCIGDSRKADQDDAIAKFPRHSFHCYSPQVFENYPNELKERYQDIIVTDTEDGKCGAIMFTKPLSDEVLKDETNFSELERHMEEDFKRSLDGVIRTYVYQIRRKSSI